MKYVTAEVRRISSNTKSDGEAMTPLIREPSPGYHALCSWRMFPRMLKSLTGNSALLSVLGVCEGTYDL
jgi:hypothetical protein